MKCGENTERWKLAVVLFAVALASCLAMMPGEVEANGVENVKLADASLDF